MLADTVADDSDRIVSTQVNNTGGVLDTANAERVAPGTLPCRRRLRDDPRRLGVDASLRRAGSSLGGATGGVAPGPRADTSRRAAEPRDAGVSLRGRRGRDQKRVDRLVVR